MQKILFFFTLILQNAFVYGVIWSAPTTVYNSGCVHNTLNVDIDSTGDGFIIWNKVDSLVPQIQYTNKNLGTWSDPNNLNFSIRNLTINQFSMNSNTDVVLLSTDSINTQTVLANSLTSDFWGPSETLSEPPLYSSSAKISTSANGITVAVWSSNDGTYNTIHGAVFSSGNWSTSTLLSDPKKNAFNPAVGTDANGNAVATWTVNDSAGNHIQTVEYESDSWQSVITLTGTGANSIFPDIAVNSSGDALVVWGEYTSSQNLHICSAKLTAGSWSSPTLIAAPNYITQFPTVVIDASGDGCCVWNEYDGTNSRVKTALFSSGTWQTSTFISETGKTANKGKLASDDLGNFVCVWNAKNGSNQTLHAATYEGSWSAPETLSALGKTVETYDLGINESGDVIVSWLSSDSSSSTIEIKTTNF